MSTCIHFPDDPTAVCSLCKPKPKPIVNSWALAVPTAKYNGTCAECGGTIYEGDVIDRRNDSWVHLNCEASS